MIRNHIIKVRVSLEELSKLKAKASRRGLTLPAMLRENALLFDIVEKE